MSEPAPSPDLESFDSYVAAFPGELSIWDYPGDSLELLLRAAEVQNAAELKQAKDPRIVVRGTRALQDAEGVLIKWGAERRSQARSRPDLSKSKFRRYTAMASEAIDHAYHWPQLETALILARRGLQGYESSDFEIRFPLTTDIRFEALDRLISRPWSAELPDWVLESGWIGLLRDWARAQTPGTAAVMTDREFRAAQRYARQLRSLQPREFSSDIELGGYTLSQAHEMWDVIHALAFVASLLTIASLHADTSLMSPTRDVLLATLQAATGLDSSICSSFLASVTYRPGHHPDPAIAPLVEDEDGYLIPSGLVISSNFERNLLRAIALDTAIQGPIGDERGARGAKQWRTFFVFHQRSRFSRVLRSCGQEGSTQAT